MNKGLSSNRTAYNSSSSLYGGDIQLEDADLDNYWKNGAKKSKKKKKQAANIAAVASSSSAAAPAPSKKARGARIPSGMVNLGYGLIDESSSSVFSQTAVSGQSRELEKDYLRLTTVADPAKVRSPETLVASLSMVKRKWIDTQDYEYCCNQLKSIRQDCTVQHLRNWLVVDVYETHARIGLESGDFQEFAQCLSRVLPLYKELAAAAAEEARSKRKPSSVDPTAAARAFERECEFSAYKILYACLMTGPSDAGLATFINSLSDEQEQHEAVAHALSVRNALLTTNFYRFFNLWSAAPNMSGYLMDPLADSMRQRAARTIAAAYRPKLSLSLLARMLAFDRMDEAENEAMAAAAPSSSPIAAPSPSPSPEPTLSSSSSAADSRPPPSLAALRACKAWLESKFDGSFVFLKEPPADGKGAPTLYVDCKATHDKLAPSNAAHRLPINSARARHTLVASSAAASSSSAAAAPPTAGPHDVGMWLKRDALASLSQNGRLALGRLDSTSPVPLRSLSSSSTGQPRSSTRVSLSSSPSPTPSPPPEDAVSRKRKNSTPLNMLSYEQLKAEVEELEAELLQPNIKDKYDDFSLQLLISRQKALRKALKKAKKAK